MGNAGGQLVRPHPVISRWMTEQIPPPTQRVGGLGPPRDIAFNVDL